MGNEIHKHLLAGTINIALYGPDHLLPARLLAAVEQKADQDKVCYLKAASDKHGKGYQEIVEAKFGTYDSVDHDAFGDGAALEATGQAIIMRTADCPAVVWFEEVSRKGYLVHCGRAAMSSASESGNPIDKERAELLSTLEAIGEIRSFK